jgi:DNA polymerase-3 subunit alpha (Gram-positive type)
MVFVSFDVETTGLNSKNERVVEIGAVKFRGQTCIATTNWLINPGKTIPKGVIRVHGITDKMVKHEPHARTILIKFKKFMGDAPLIAHNARFDVGFIAQECRKSNIRVPKNKVIDSLPMSRKYFPDAPAHNLVALTKYLNLEDTGHHRALADSIYVYHMMAMIFEKQADKLTFEDLEKTAGMPWPEIKKSGNRQIHRNQ